jgi:hypothetical protein
MAKKPGMGSGYPDQRSLQRNRTRSAKEEVMNIRTKNHHGSVLFLVVVLLGVSLGACGVDDPTGNTTQTAGGVVTTGTPTIGLNLCMQCHPSVTAEWEETRHANLNTSPTFTTTELCAGCHDKNGDSQQLAPNRMVVGCESCHGPGSLHYDDGGAGPIMTAAYSAGVISGITSTLAVSGQLLTCMECHQLLDVNDPASLTTPTTAMHTDVTGTQVITDTHFATPNSWVVTGNTSTALFAITGYALEYASESVCTDCHNPHGVNDINQEWAASAHAARYSLGKDPQGYFSDAWSHYNWSESSRRTCQRCHTTSGFRAYADALGSGNTSLATQIRTGQVSLITPTAGWKPEMLKCNGCHSDFKGTLRDPGAITALYSYSTVTNSVTYTLSDASFAYPDADKSNVCIACHTGLESGETIKTLSLSTAPTITTMDNIGFINSHYLTAGGTVFTATGFEFDGRSYENPLSYQHDDIGMNDFRSTGTDGPCVGCHMSRPNGNGDHLFMPVSRFNRVRYNAGTVDVTQGDAIVTGVSTTWTPAGIDTAADHFLGPDGRTYLIASVDGDTTLTLTTPYTGSSASSQTYVIAKEGERIAGIASEACFSCHAGATSALVEQLNEEHEMFEASLAAFERSLDMRGICFVEAYPYFHKRRTDTGLVSVTTGSTVVIGNLTTFQTSSVTASADRLRTADGEQYEIQSVDGEMQLTLKTPYRGPTVADAPYTIMMTGSANAVRDWDVTDQGEAYGKNFMGAAFNFNLIEHDPGAYVHNRTYAKRLIYDSIDWLDDASLNNSVGATLNGLDGTIFAWKADAMAYLLPNGVLGIPAERP